MKFDRENHELTEADLTAEFCAHAKLAGLDIFLEVFLPSAEHRSGQMRADVIVVDGEEIICAVEIKRPGKKIPSLNTRQGGAYHWLGVKHGVSPFYLNRFEDIQSLISEIREEIEAGREIRAEETGQLSRPRLHLVAGAGTPSAP